MWNGNLWQATTYHTNRSNTDFSNKLLTIFLSFELQRFFTINLLRSYLIKGLTVPLVAIKYPTISTNLLKHLNRKNGK
jgi:hypothetical protein